MFVFSYQGILPQCALSIQPALQAWGLKKKDATYEKHGASIAKLKHNAAYTLNHLTVDDEGDACHDVDWCFFFVDQSRGVVCLLKCRHDSLSNFGGVAQYSSTVIGLVSIQHASSLSFFVEICEICVCINILFYRVSNSICLLSFGITGHQGAIHLAT